MQVLLAQPRGFCAGVTRAIAIVERALKLYGSPIYVRHEIVHNRTVVENLRERGAVFVDDLATACRAPSRKRPARGAFASSTRPARSSRRFTEKSAACARKAARSS